MKHHLIIVPLTALVAASPLMAVAQDRGRGPATNEDVLTRRIVPAPESGDIVVRFGDSTRIYFKQPIKSIKLGDEFAVRAVPQSDHIVEFTGLSPGRSALAVESK